MSLIEKLAQPAGTNSNKCGIGALLSQLPDSEREALIDALDLDKSEWGHKALQRLLAEEGYEVSLRSLERHRRNECKCKK